MARKLLIKIFLLVCTVSFATGIMTANAAPLASGTVLKITPGVGAGSDPNIPCTSGSCIGWFLAPGFILWSNILPGTDGGFIVGKSQISGGQEFNPFSTASGQLTSAGTMAAPWIPAGSVATLYTMPDGGSVNLFDDTSCIKAGCIGKAALKTLGAAVNGNSIPIGSGNGSCIQPGCTSDQLAGIFVNNYAIDLVGKTWSLDYSQVVQSGSWQNLPLYIKFTGTIHNCPIVDYAWGVPGGVRSLMVFGWNLRGVTGVRINGVNAPVSQAIGDDLLWVLPPDSVTWPWKPGTVQVTNANAGCSSYYPSHFTP